MKVLVTVGTTRFLSLFEAFDKFADVLNEFEFVYQIADCAYWPRTGEVFEFTNNIETYYQEADLVVTHAGAGSIYRLLELNKKILIVPNLERVDDHQLDIAKYMEAGGHALVCYDLAQLPQVFEQLVEFEPVKFQKIPFNKVDEIAEFINSI